MSSSRRILRGAIVAGIAGVVSIGFAGAASAAAVSPDWIVQKDCKVEVNPTVDYLTATYTINGQSATFDSPEPLQFIGDTGNAVVVHLELTTAGDPSVVTEYDPFTITIDKCSTTVVESPSPSASPEPTVAPTTPAATTPKAHVQTDLGTSVQNPSTTASNGDDFGLIAGGIAVVLVVGIGLGLMAHRHYGATH